MARRVEQKSDWIRCAKSPTKTFAKPVILSENEIILSPYGKNEYLRKYDIEKDKFCPYIPYPTEINIKFHTIAADRETGKIYLYDGTDKTFVEFDVHKQLVTKCKKKAKQSIVGNGKFSSSLVHKGSFHVIGGSEKDRHLIWDTMKQKFIEHEMIQPSPAGHSSIVLQANDSHNAQIVVFGGNDSIKLKKYLDTIYICDIHPEIQWKKLKEFKMPYKQYFFGCVVFQQTYIIIFGGKQKGTNKNNSGLSDEIWVLQLKNWKWSRAHLKCPKKAKYYAVLTDGDMVHLFEYEGMCGHWKIPIAILINRSTRIRSESLTSQIKVLTDKLTEITEENEELLDAQKESKYKMKTLKTKNKELANENNKLKKEIDLLKKAKGGNAVKSSLLQANDDYNALNEKYKQLQNQMQAKANGIYNNNNGNSKSVEVNLLEIMNDTSTATQIQSMSIATNISEPANTMLSNPFAADNDYDFWDYTNIVQWINGLENGKYRKYVNIMQNRLKQRNIDGHTFVNFQLNDLKNYGCTNYNDAVALLQQMKKLKASNDAFDTPNTSTTNLPGINALNTNNNNINNNNNNTTHDLFDSLFN